MTRRSRAREIVLQMLYQDDLNPKVHTSAGEDFVRRRLRTTEMVEFARGLLAGVRRHRPHIDKLIQDTAANWTLTRMAVVDRNVLRLGAYEVLYSETPARVALNEALELAKRYGTGHSAAFVNGILDKLLQKRGSDAADGRTTPPESAPPLASPSS